MQGFFFFLLKNSEWSHRRYWSLIKKATQPITISQPINVTNRWRKQNYFPTCGYSAAAQLCLSGTVSIFIMIMPFVYNFCKCYFFNLFILLPTKIFEMQKQPILTINKTYNNTIALKVVKQTKNDQSKFHFVGFFCLFFCLFFGFVVHFFRDC